MRFAIPIAAFFLLCLVVSAWFVFLHKDVSEKVVHNGFNAPLMKVVFNGQRKQVELDDPESLACIQRTMSREQVGGNGGVSYEVYFYLSNGKVDNLNRVSPKSNLS